jgi:hypothetical protein
MNLIVVECSRLTDGKGDEPRLGVVIADDSLQAEELCKAIYASDGFSQFVAKTVVEGLFAGPARVLGYTDQNGAFSWK